MRVCYCGVVVDDGLSVAPDNENGLTRPETDTSGNTSELSTSAKNAGLDNTD